MRQSKRLGDVLVVGIHGDAEITRNKGPPLMNERERYRLTRALKWPDEIVEDAPYQTLVETLDRARCAFCVHGDDISTTADGVDSFKQVKDLGRYKECKRTDGISTTALIGRLLSLERAHHRSFPQLVQAVLAPEPAPQLTGPFYWTIHSGNVIDIAPDQQVISYREGSGPTPQQRVVYLAGSFDLLHEGHLDLLEASKADNDFLIVGVHDDLTVNSYMGQSFPIMSAIERALGVLMLRIVDQVVVTGLSITAEFLEHFKIHRVVPGESLRGCTVDPFVVVKCKGIFHPLAPQITCTTEDIVTRLMAARDLFEKRNQKKVAKDAIANAR
eukprot:m.718532 g.718532  ORF g.718532 m.718532 type:complete len:329 (-) comp58809_c1_seq40:1652-2638(-)